MPQTLNPKTLNCAVKDGVGLRPPYLCGRRVFYSPHVDPYSRERGLVLLVQVILLLILVSTVTTIMDTYSETSPEWLDHIGTTLAFLFLIEMLIKILAMVRARDLNECVRRVLGVNVTAAAIQSDLNALYPAKGASMIGTLFCNDSNHTH